MTFSMLCSSFETPDASTLLPSVLFNKIQLLYVSQIFVSPLLKSQFLQMELGAS